MATCVTHKKCYLTKEIAEDVLIEAQATLTETENARAASATASSKSAVAAVPFASSGRDA